MLLVLKISGPIALSSSMKNSVCERGEGGLGFQHMSHDLFGCESLEVF